MMFDLNKIPANEEEEEEEEEKEVEVPTVMEVNQEVVEEITTKRTNDPHGTQGYRTDAEDTPLIGPWQTLSPSELSSLYNMVQVPANYHRVHHVITHRANGTYEHAWISWLPAHHASPGGTVMHSSEWRTMPSIFHAAPPLPAHPIASRPPGQAAPDVSSAFFDPRRLWSHSGLHQAAPQATTKVAEMECHGDSEQSGSNGNRFEPAFGHRNNMRTKKSMMERRSAVRLVELGPDSGDGTGVPKPVGVRTPLRSAQNQQDIGSSSQKEPENHDEAEFNTDSANIGAELLGHLAREERRKMREAAFLAEFNFTTQRCSATAPCSTCLEFFKAPMPVDLAEESRSCLGALYVDDDRPPVLKNIDEEEAAQRKGARHGPKSKSSQYRGVTFYKRTGRWESHIWHEAAQVYLGASATKELAAKAYDKAAIMLGGPDVDINFEPESYQNEMRYLYKLSKEQLVIYLRRDSRGLGAQAAYPGVKHVKNHYQAICGATLLGTFSTEDEAARIVYRAAVKESFGTLASLIVDTHHVRNMPSFAAQRYAALYPETVEVMMQTRSKRGRKSFSPPKKCSSPSTRQKPSSESSPLIPSATVSPNPMQKLPTIQEQYNPESSFNLHSQQPLSSTIDENGPPAAKRSRTTWGQHLACRRAYKEAHRAKAAAAPNPPAMSVERPAPSTTRACNTTSPGVGVSRISPSSATVLSTFSGIGQTSTPSSVPACSVSSSSLKKRSMTSDTISAPAGVIRFRLFNVDIIVADETCGHGGPGGLGNVNPLGAQTRNEVEAARNDLYTPPLVTDTNQFDKLVLPMKRCQATGDWNPYLPHALATEMAAGLTNVVAINNRLHEILSETVPQAPGTRLPLEGPEVRTARLPNPNRCTNPNCVCQRQFHR